MPRTIIPLNEGWTFSLDGTNFTPVSIPHDWCIERPVDVYKRQPYSRPIYVWAYVDLEP